MKRTTYYFVFFFALVTVLCISSLLMLMMDNDQDGDHDSEVITQQAENQQQEYWTKERMQSAEPQSMPTMNRTETFKKLLIDNFPIWMMLFIICTFTLMFILLKKSSTLEKQYKDVLDQLSDRAYRQKD